MKAQASPAGRVVVLNGASSSGKTTLARGVQALSTAEPFLHVQLDAFRAMEPAGYWSEEGRASWPVRLEALCRSIDAAAKAYALHRQGVLVDHVLLPRPAWHWLAEDLAGIPVLLVGVHCAAAELTRRAQDRGDRPVGLGESQAGRVHAAAHYDFEIDTTSTPAGECAQRLHAWLAGDPAPRAIDFVRA